MRALAFWLVLGSCGDDPAALPVCGDGTLDPEREWCDDGADNGDTPDACRADCTLPRCGDAVVDGQESCDDGDNRGGDGCSPDCLTEDGALEVEPNDDAAAAQLASEVVFGELPAGDVDCWAVEVAAGGYVEARAVQGDDCADVTLSLENPAGEVVAVASPAPACTHLDPVEEPGARFLEAGRYTVCAAGFLGADVEGYQLDVRTGDSCTLDGIGWRLQDDADGDGRVNACDEDDDDDGIEDGLDNCPDFANGGGAVTLRPDTSGFVRTWLALGPLTGVRSTDRCMPTPDRLGASDATAVPELAEEVAGARWRVLRSGEGRVDLVGPYGSVAAPREAYLAVWVSDPKAPRTLTLGLGPDDGARAWWDGAVVLEDPRCQGTAVDANKVSVVTRSGWVPLLVKVYDQGGGWGVYTRFLDGTSPVTDLDLSLAPGPWRPDQADRDGDGRGDVCDPEP